MSCTSVRELPLFMVKDEAFLGENIVWWTWKNSMAFCTNRGAPKTENIFIKLFVPRIIFIENSQDESYTVTLLVLL
jgi:hypothetical protein